MTEAPGARATVVVHTKLAPSVQSASVSDPVVPAGIGSVFSTAAGSIEGPPLVGVQACVVAIPATTEPTPSSLVIDRSEDFDTVSVSVSWRSEERRVGKECGFVAVLARVNEE